MQLHRRFTTEQIRAMLNGYQRGNLTVREALDLLEVKPTTFFTLARRYRENPEAFSIDYKRRNSKKISPRAEKMIQQAISDDRQLIQDPKIPVWTYNYSAIRDRLAEFRLMRIELYAAHGTLRSRASFYRGVSSVYQFKWEKAREAFKSAFGDTAAFPDCRAQFEKLDSLLVIACTSARKNPELAKWLSTCLPGAGQFYSGDWQNSLNALAANSATGYLLASDIARREWKDAVLTYLFLFNRYYLGNRYNAAMSAQDRNRHEDEKLREKILSAIEGSAE